VSETTMPACLHEIDPSALLDPVSRTAWGLLCDAVRVLQGDGPGWARGAARPTTARAWMLADDGDWPLSFVGACALLGLDAARLRRDLARWLA
jgi:hypothetical protein